MARGIVGGLECSCTLLKLPDSCGQLQTVLLHLSCLKAGGCRGSGCLPFLLLPCLVLHCRAVQIHGVGIHRLGSWRQSRRGNSLDFGARTVWGQDRLHLVDSGCRTGVWACGRTVRSNLLLTPCSALITHVHALPLLHFLRQRLEQLRLEGRTRCIVFFRASGDGVGTVAIDPVKSGSCRAGVWKTVGVGGWASGGGDKVG